MSTAPPPNFATTPDTDKISVSLTAPAGFSSIDNSVMVSYFLFDTASPSIQLYNQNPSFTVSNLLPSTNYMFYCNGYYDRSTSNYWGISFNATTCPSTGCRSAAGGVNSTTPKWVPFLGFLAIIPAALVVCCCILFVVACIIGCAIVKRRKKKAAQGQEDSKTKKKNYELVMTPTTGNDVQDTLKEKFMKQYILDYNKLVFATQVLGTGAQVCFFCFVSKNASLTIYKRELFTRVPI